MNAPLVLDLKPLTREVIEAAVMKCAARLVRNVPIARSTSIHADLGMDSLDVIDFEMSLEEELDVELPADLIRDHDTLGDLIERLAVHLKAEK